MFDYVLKNGTIVDGSGAKPYRADLCIQNGLIQKITPDFHGEATHVLDVRGKIVSPGFIDIHTHSDTVPLLAGMNPESKLFQGVTLEITGNCGISHIPITKKYQEELTQFYNATLPANVDYIYLNDTNVADYAAHVAQHPPAIHYGVLIGHGTLRGAVMGFGMRAPSPEEQSQMEVLLDQQLEQGAFGMSLGLIYPPSSFSQKEELVRLAKVLAARDRILAVHMRNESDRVFEAVDEILDIAKQSGVHLEISHLKLMGKAQWGRVEELLGRLEKARQDGVRVTCDQYPFHASSTGLSALVPGWAHDGGVIELTRRMANPTPKLLEEIQAEMERRGGPSTILVVGTHGHLPECDGKNIEDIAASWKLDPARAVARCLAAASGAVSCIYFTMDLKDVYRIMQDMRVSVGSDGVSYEYASAAEHCFHPRNFNTFPRFIQTAREMGILTPEQAVYKMTGLPASVLGLKDRGLIRLGMAADLTVFDWEKVRDTSTYLVSAVKPLGIDYVFVEGEPALMQGVQTPIRNGRVLFRE